MMRIALLLSFIALVVADELDWESWKKVYGKQYVDDATEQKRHQIWMDNLDYVTEHNSNAEEHGFTLGMNHLADLTNEEFHAMYNGYQMHPTNSSKADVFKASPDFVAADEVDWRKEGAVTEVKNQGQCGSCWAFSTTGSLEGQHFLKTKDLVSLSEQNLVDCSKSYGNHGCGGGLMDNAFDYIIHNHGVDTEKSYPYRGHDEHCRFEASNVGATMKKFRNIWPHGDVKALTEAIQKVGPISVAMDARYGSFQLYKEGVYRESKCSSRKLDHGVLAVGFGTYEGEPYFLVKNSWGEKWGMDGYFMILRDYHNMCGLATQASYPIVD